MDASITSGAEGAGEMPEGVRKRGRFAFNNSKFNRGGLEGADEGSIGPDIVMG